MEIISIEGMEFRAPVGCFDEEKIVHPGFSVDVYISFDASKAMLSDKLETTINYQAVYLRIKEIMEVKHNIIEHVANHILDAILSDFPLAQHVKCKIHKTFPALGGRIAAVAFEAERGR
ncbi:MAG TPA: dihydroneopterin aldolase [Bacteroidales bacterium]|nr:dihydroneopterin aldolase [Bacteroidales bacterium]